MTSAVDRVKLEETGWLIELGARTLVSPQWWSLPADDEGQWTSDSAKALRFARKVDADAYIREVGWTEAFASEHMWSDPHPRQSAFDGWWSTDGQYLDPDTSDVPWFDKRRGLAEYAFNAGARILSALAPVEAEPHAWMGYWPGAGSVNSETHTTHSRPRAEAWRRDGVEVTPLYTHPNPSPTGQVEWTPQEVRSLVALASADKERLLPNDVAVITGLLDRLSGRRA